jgi:hypothetical protein
MTTVLAVAAAIVGIAAAIGVSIRTGVWLAKSVRRVTDFLDDWNGEAARPGYPARKGVPERLSTMEDRLGRVEGQMRPNGGSTLRDAVDRIDRAIESEAPQ